ncbi:Pkinase-domain-containing protein [Calocera viscosa TUFC12733]|uniref:Pkinase-domain-containing protein n=1 Tax=Calocera viscosa (strain TUFC12733) TaxID=1330018 RepID=A0A167PPS8_CALVF|nr:Pkinase-domain-containing protein [Calocera viscosa TUFC12733]
MPDAPYTPTGKSPTQATFLHVPSSPFTPPFTPPHTAPLPLPPLEQPKPRPAVYLPLPQHYLPPTPTSPALTVPLPPSRPVSPQPDAPLPANLFPAGHQLLPDFLHRYQLHASPELGSGGFGFVLLAQKRYGDRRDVAVKFIVKDKMPRHSWILDRDYGMLPIEITVLRLVKHENIVEFIEFFQDEVYFYLVQELHGTPWTPQPTLLPLPPTPTTPLPASPISPTSPFPMHLAPAAGARPTPVRRASYDLFECIERHTRLSEEVARHIFRQVVHAVSYLHVLGIYHRDIKDENILIDQDFRVKLIDFGSSAITDTRRPAPFHDRFFGTMNFASPEILMNKPYRAPPAEIWTLGILLHILVTGECPFSSTQAAIEGRISQPRKGVFMSRDCEALVRGCLEVDVEKRLSISDVARHPWLMRK